MHHRLDRQHHSFLQPRIWHPTPKIVRHLWILVQAAPYAVPSKLLNHRKARAFRDSLHGAGDIADSVADPSLLNACVKGVTGNAEQSISITRNPADCNSSG